MKISEIKSDDKKVNVLGKITKKESAREFERNGNTSRVCSAELTDDSGSIILTLWDKEIDTYKINDKVHISNGYVKEFMGKLQLNVGKFGTIEIIEE